MKKQTTRLLTGLVQLAVFIGCMAMTDALAQINPPASSQTFADANGEYTLEWITVKRPPMPPVRVNGKWVPWEEVHGPLPPFPPRQVKRYKNPKPVDPEAQWLGIKRRLAPWMTEEELRAKPAMTPALEVTKRRATFKQGFIPKMDPVQLREATKKRAERQRQAAENYQDPPRKGSGGGDEEEDDPTPIPRLELVDVHSDEFGNTTQYELWITDAPADEIYEIYFADELNPNRWQFVYVGYPQIGYGTSIQKFYLQTYGHPPQGFFRAFPLNDTDGDGISDGMEICVFHSDPNNPDSGFMRDANGDGQPDFPGTAGNWVTDGDEDFDGDGYSNLKELWMGTDPLVPNNRLPDTDGDGLPDWVESLIWIYQGIPNSAPEDDSDGDGVDNFTEILALTDPSWADAVYSYGAFYNLPDSQRAFFIPPITVQHTASTNAASTNHLIFDNAGTLGTYLHLEVRRNEDADGDPSPGYDTILFGGGFASPLSGLFLDSLLPEFGLPTTSEALDEIYSTKYQILSRVTGMLAGIWDEAKISDAIDAFDIESLAVIKQRSMLRTVVRLRELQLAVDITDASTGAQMRLRTAVSEIHSEVTIFRETSFKIASYQRQGWATRAGHWLSIGGRIATVYNVIGAGRDVGMTPSLISTIIVGDVTIALIQREIWLHR